MGSESFFAPSEKAEALILWELPANLPDDCRISAITQSGRLTEKEFWWLPKASYSRQRGQPRASSGLLRSQTAIDTWSLKVMRCKQIGPRTETGLLIGAGRRAAKATSGQFQLTDAIRFELQANLPWIGIRSGRPMEGISTFAATGPAI